jgi:hypothetical protein
MSVRGLTADGRVAAVVAATVIVVASLSGCVTAQSCASWPDYQDEQSRIDESDLVVDVVVIGRDGTEPMFGADANAWIAEVRSVVSADDPEAVRDGDPIRLVSTPDTCASGGMYASGDPLDTRDEVRVYLVESSTSDGSWNTITPFDGVGPLEE